MTSARSLRLFALLALSACMAVSALGCGTLMRLGSVSTLSSPGPDPRELSIRRRAFDELVERLADPEAEPLGEVVLRLSLTGGWGLPDPGELHMTIEDDGRVVRVTDRSVFSSTDDYTSLRLDRAGILLVLTLTRPFLPALREDLDGGAGVSPTDRSAWLEVGDAFVLSMDRIGQTDGYTSEQRAWRVGFGELLERLVDLRWLGGSIVEPQSPWVPASITVLAGSVSTRSGLDPGSPFATWPLDRSIEEAAVGTQLDAYGQERLVLCLTGEDAAAVFALLTGVNHAYLRVDDGKPWELDVRPHYPGYRLVGDPCP